MIIGVEWVVGKAKIKKETTQMIEFRMAMMFICAHKAPIFHNKT